MYFLPITLVPSHGFPDFNSSTKFGPPLSVEWVHSVLSEYYALLLSNDGARDQHVACTSVLKRLQYRLPAAWESMTVTHCLSQENRSVSVVQCKKRARGKELKEGARMRTNRFMTFQKNDSSRKTSKNRPSGKSIGNISSRTTLKHTQCQT